MDLLHSLSSQRLRVVIDYTIVVSYNVHNVAYLNEGEYLSPTEMGYVLMIFVTFCSM